MSGRSNEVHSCAQGFGMVDIPWRLRKSDASSKGGRKIIIEKRIIGKYPLIYTTLLDPTPLATPLTPRGLSLPVYEGFNIGGHCVTPSGSTWGRIEWGIGGVGGSHPPKGFRG